MNAIPDQFDGNSSIFYILKREVEQKLESPVEINFYDGPLEEAIAKNPRVRKKTNLDQYSLNRQEGFIVPESMLSCRNRTAKICYIKKNASQHTKIHELFHFISPFIAPHLPKCPSFDQLIEHHALRSLDEFWADYQSVFYLNKNGVLLTENDLKGRGLNKGDRLGHRIGSFFENWLNYKRNRLNMRIIYSAVVNFYEEFKFLMYLFGLMRGFYDIKDTSNFNLLEQTWTQFIEFVQKWSDWNKMKTEFHPNFLGFIQKLYSVLCKGGQLAGIPELKSTLIPVFMDYTVQGFLPNVYPDDLDIIILNLRSDLKLDHLFHRQKEHRT